jgi:membrane-associated phospholipid phosphatase
MPRTVKAQGMKTVFGAMAALVLVVLSIHLLDLPLAAWIAARQWAHAVHAIASKVPELSYVVVILTGLSWVVYFYLVRENTLRTSRAFCLVTGTTLPLSFGVKTVLKWIFGRTETRTWLKNLSPDGFHWFAGKQGYFSFPSGHMLVLTPLFLALWHFYPRYRAYSVAAWCCLGAALIATDAHYLSDVLAGAYFGALVYLATTRTIEALRTRMRRSLMTARPE